MIMLRDQYNIRMSCIWHYIFMDYGRLCKEAGVEEWEVQNISDPTTNPAKQGISIHMRWAGSS